MRFFWLLPSAYLTTGTKHTDTTSLNHQTSSVHGMNLNISAAGSRPTAREVKGLVSREPNIILKARIGYRHVCSATSYSAPFKKGLLS